MKKALKTILGCICIASILLAGSENPDGTVNLLWTLSWMGAATISGYLWNKIRETR